MKSAGVAAREGSPPKLPDSVEECLKQGLVHRAQELGWWGDESAYLLVRDGGSHNFHVTLPKKRAVADLGFDLSDAKGIAVIKKVWSSSVAGADGQLREGDIIRGVDAQPLWTCEAVVSAIRSGRGQVSLSVARSGGPSLAASSSAAGLRPADVAASSGRFSWKADRLLVAAGDAHRVTFHSPGNVVLQYSFRVQDHDIAMEVSRVGAVVVLQLRGQEAPPPLAAPLLQLRGQKLQGVLHLPEAGPHVVRWDNTYSYFRSKRLGFSLSLLPASAWEGEQRGAQCLRLEAEAARCKEQAREVGEAISGDEAKLAALRKQVEKLERSLGRSRKERDEHMAKWREAKAGLKSLQEGGAIEGGGGGAPSATAAPAQAPALAAT